MKTCNRCGFAKALECFAYAATNADRRRGHCRECQKLEDQQRYAENPEPYKIKSVEWQLNNPEKRKAIKRKADKKRRDKMRRSSGFPDGIAVE